MKKRQNIILIILLVLLIVTILSGVTFAAYTWQTLSSQNKEIQGITSCFNVNYVKGDNIGSNENNEILSLGSSYLDGLSTTVKMSLDDSCDIDSGVGIIYLNTDSEIDNYFIDNKLLHYEVLVDSISVNHGIIDTKDSIPIYSNFDVTTDEKKITVYIWLNGELVTNDNWDTIVNLVYRGSITARVDSR